MSVAAPTDKETDSVNGGRCPSDEDVSVEGSRLCPTELLGGDEKASAVVVASSGHCDPVAVTQESDELPVAAREEEKLKEELDTRELEVCETQELMEVTSEPRVNGPDREATSSIGSEGDFQEAGEGGGPTDFVERTKGVDCGEEVSAVDVSVEHTAGDVQKDPAAAKEADERATLEGPREGDCDSTSGNKEEGSMVEKVVQSCANDGSLAESPANESAVEISVLEDPVPAESDQVGESATLEGPREGDCDSTSRNKEEASTIEKVVQSCANDGILAESPVNVEDTVDDVVEDPVSAEASMVEKVVQSCANEGSSAESPANESSVEINVEHAAGDVVEDPVAAESDQVGESAALEGPREGGCDSTSGNKEEASTVEKVVQPCANEGSSADSPANDTPALRPQKSFRQMQSMFENQTAVPPNVTQTEKRGSSAVGAVRSKIQLDLGALGPPGANSANSKPKQAEDVRAVTTGVSVKALRRNLQAMLETRNKLQDVGMAPPPPPPDPQASEKKKKMEERAAALMARMGGSRGDSVEPANGEPKESFTLASVLGISAAKEISLKEREARVAEEEEQDEDKSGTPSSLHEKIRLVEQKVKQQETQDLQVNIVVRFFDHDQLDVSEKKKLKPADAKFCLSPYFTAMDVFQQACAALKIVDPEIFGLFCTDATGSLVWMHDDMTLASYGIGEGSVLEVKYKSNTSAVLVAMDIGGPDLVRIRFQYDQETTVESAIPTLAGQASKMSGQPVEAFAHFGLFSPSEYVFCRPLDRIMAMELDVQEELEFRERKEVASTKHVTQKVTIVTDSDDASFAQLNGSTSTVKIFKDRPIAESLPAIGKKWLIKRIREWGLYFQPSAKNSSPFWLDRTKEIGDYNLKGQMFFKQHLKPFSVAFPGHLSATYRLTSEQTVADLLGMINETGGKPPLTKSMASVSMASSPNASRDNSNAGVPPPPPPPPPSGAPPPPPPPPPPSSDSKPAAPKANTEAIPFDVSDYGLYLPLPYKSCATPLPMTRNIWDLGLKKGEQLFFKRNRQALNVRGEVHDEVLEEEFNVNYELKAAQILGIVCRRWGCRPAHHFTLIVGDHPVPYNKPFINFVKPNSGDVVQFRRLPDEFIPPEEPVPEDEVNIWDGPPDITEGEGVNIIFSEDKGDGSPRSIEATTLNKLVERLTTDQGHDLDFQRMLLMTFESFTTAEMLLTKLLERYYVPRQPGVTHEQFVKVQTQIQLRVVNVLKSWFPSAWSDFSDELKKYTRKFCTETLLDDGKPSYSVLLWLATLPDKGPGEKHAVEIIPAKKAKKKIQSPWDYDVEEIARQLCLIEFKNYASIAPSELLNPDAWAKEKYAYLAPNLMSLIAHFNDVSVWIILSILSVDKVKARAARFAQVVEVAAWCAKFNNFSTVMAIVSGINTAAILRLKWTRGLLKKKTLKTLEELEELVNAESSYKRMRSEIAKAKPPLVPYIGVYLKDLTFIDDGNQDRVKGLINVEKRRLVYDQIAKIKLYQDVPYAFEEVKILYTALNHCNPGLTEKDLYQLSLVLEPRKATKKDIK